MDPDERTKEGKEDTKSETDVGGSRRKWDGADGWRSDYNRFDGLFPAVASGGERFRSMPAHSRELVRASSFPFFHQRACSIVSFHFFSGRVKDDEV